MKQACLLAALLLTGLVSHLLASGARPAWRSPPHLIVPEVIDFGECDLGTVASRPVVLANQGGQPLIIEGVRSSCACSGLEVIQNGEPRRVERLTIEPSTQASLSMRVAISGKVGESLSHMLLLNTNDPQRPTVQIPVRVNRVKGGFLYEPTGVAFGQVSLGKPARQVLRVLDDARPARAVAAVSSSQPNRFTVEYRLVADEPASTLYRCVGVIEVFASATEEGPLDGEVVVHRAGSEEPPDRVPVRGTVVGPITVTPRFLALPRKTPAGLVHEAECVVAARDDTPFSLAASTVPKGRRAEVFAISQSKFKVKVQRKSGASDGEKQAVLLLQARTGSGIIPAAVYLQSLPD